MTTTSITAPINIKAEPFVAAAQSAFLPWRTLMSVGMVLSTVWVGWIYIMASTGWYLDPERAGLIWLPVVLQFILTALCLWLTRRGQGFGAQVERGLAMTALAAVPTYLGALVITGVLFSGYFSELRIAQEASLLASGLDVAATVTQLDKAQPSNTPGGFAFASFMGTLAMGLFASLGAAAILRERGLKK